MPHSHIASLSVYSHVEYIYILYFRKCVVVVVFLLVCLCVGVFVFNWLITGLSVSRITCKNNGQIFIIFLK